MAIASICIGIIAYFNMEDAWWLWVIISCAIAIGTSRLLYKRYRRRKRIVTKRYANENNNFDAVIKFLPVRYIDKIDSNLMLHNSDDKITELLYQNIGEVFITLGLYTDSFHRKVNPFTCKRYISIDPIGFHCKLSTDNGIGYILIDPSPQQVEYLRKIDTKIIHNVLRKMNLINWDIERISFDDDVILFRLRDSTVSMAYDLRSE
ncbi:hypothetical protein [Anaerosporobacter sp.]|uniref:hypothetical protein n=1 Tax=Anaerosporobacter sp. TaxID=1872529 RepID=UPI00286F8C7C|nr:hypothetical protein [Anaerosporobacter sp.]